MIFKNLPEEAYKHIGILFSYFYGLYPSTFSLIKSVEDVRHCKQMWGHAFQNSGIISENGEINLKIIHNGIKKLFTLDQQFMPSCGQFINLCLQKDCNGKDKGGMSTDIE